MSNRRAIKEIGTASVTVYDDIDEGPLSPEEEARVRAVLMFWCRALQEHGVEVPGCNPKIPGV